MSLPTPEVPPTFANFDLVFANPQDIYTIGAKPGGTGVLPEMAEAFGYKLAAEPNEKNLEGLVEAVGQAKTLQDNIPNVQKRLGTALARSWALRTGFLEPVSRSYIHPQVELPKPNEEYLTMMTDGAANWMDWRADRIVSLRDHTNYAAPTLLVAGNGIMNPAENPERVKEGMTRAKYMEDYIQPHLARLGIDALIVAPKTDVGDKVMDAGVATLNRLGYRGAVVLASNGGAWPQNGGQVRRAVRRNHDSDMHVYVTTEHKVELGDGTQPTRTHQNPFSAAGQIARNHLELFRNMEQRAP